ncbi:MAG: type II toxin-antitoxin system RelE/ParE family toxin [Myxococcota bacterium]|nr:type II toxin-antitoxin system RelE/ParE family toxin [Myxococcota bacterium]
MKQTEFHPQAQAELIESARFYEMQRAGLGRRFVAAVRESIGRIEMHPYLYQTVEYDIRQSSVKRFPYGIIYRLTPERIEIIAVMHLNRKPGYWKARLKSD